MQRMEAFLNRKLYIAIVFIFTFITWTFFEPTPPYVFNLFLMIGIILLIIVHTVVLVTFQNTMYSVPLLISLLFIVNQSDMTFSTVIEFGFPILAIILFIIGPIVHLIKYKPPMKKGIFFLGFLLIALAYVIPLFYIPFDLQSIPISLMGFLYLLLYLFLSNTMRSHLDYLFKVMIFANILLTMQVFFYVYQGYIQYPELAFGARLMMGWGRNLGWANVNDMCFYIAFTLPSYLYFIFKKPNTYALWLLMIFPTFAVILTKSRGGAIGYLIALIGIIILTWMKGNRMLYKRGLLSLLVIVVLSVFLSDIYRIWYNELILSIGDNLNDFSSNRLYIYANAWEVFKANPFFGGGWISINSFPFDGRLFMYHSTIFHTLAAMGLFGVIALIIHYSQILKFMLRHLTLEKYLFIIGYIASQVHGLIDNVQYAVPYSILIVIILAMFETSRNDTIFETIDHRFHLIS